MPYLLPTFAWLVAFLATYLFVKELYLNYKNNNTISIADIIFYGIIFIFGYICVYFTNNAFLFLALINSYNHDKAIDVLLRREQTYKENPTKENKRTLFKWKCRDILCEYGTPFYFLCFIVFLLYDSTIFLMNIVEKYNLVQLFSYIPVIIFVLGFLLDVFSPLTHIPLRLVFSTAISILLGNLIYYHYGDFPLKESIIIFIVFLIISFVCATIYDFLNNMKENTEKISDKSKNIEDEKKN